MPTIEKTDTAVFHRSLGRKVSPGERIDVSEDLAAHLVESHGYERVSSDNSGGSDAEDGAAPDSLADLPGVGDATADELRGAGYDSVGDVRAADPTHLADEVDNIGDELAADLTDEAAREKAQENSEDES